MKGREGEGEGRRKGGEEVMNAPCLTWQGSIDTSVLSHWH